MAVTSFGVGFQPELARQVDGFDNIKTMRGRPPVDSEAVTLRRAIDALQILTAGAANRMICPIILGAIRRLVELGLKVTK